VNELQQMADAYKTPLSYPITMGVIPTVGPYLFPKVLPALRSKGVRSLKQRGQAKGSQAKGSQAKGSGL